MSTPSTDQGLLTHIGRLVAEEERLLADKEHAATHHPRISAIAVELDQSWDLLRQRRALREFGNDPAQAEKRDAGTVENYKP